MAERSDAERVGRFYYPKGVEEVTYDTIVIRAKKDVEAGNKHDLIIYNC